MKRILVIGSGGAGKSTLAKALSTRLNLPLIHLDRLFWKPGWVESAKGDFDRRLRGQLKKRHWVIDGNYAGSLELRLQYADTVVFLDRSRWLCLWRAFRRQLQYFGRSRPDMAEACPEKIDFEFLKWIWNYSRQNRPKILTYLEKKPKKIRWFILRSSAEVDDFLKSVAHSASGQSEFKGLSPGTR